MSAREVFKVSASASVIKKILLSQRESKSRERRATAIVKFKRPNLKGSCGTCAFAVSLHRSGAMLSCEGGKKLTVKIRGVMKQSSALMFNDEGCGLWKIKNEV